MGLDLRGRLALTFGIPIVLIGLGGMWGYRLSRSAAPTLVRPKVEPAVKQLRVAGDPWSGYSTFRKEPRLTALLAKEQVKVDYIDDAKYYDQNTRISALATGEIDIALTTLDAYLQFGGNYQREGRYPGVVIFNLDESAGGDAIFMAKGRKGFSDVKPSDRVCFAKGTPSEHLWDFASLSFAELDDDLPRDNGVVAKDCWEKLEQGKVEIAVLWQPYTALAAKAGYPKVFGTGGQADDLIVDVAVASRALIERDRPVVEQLASAYFKTIDGYTRDTAAHAQFLAADCGAECGGDPAVGSVVLEGIDFLTLEENACLWFGLCEQPSKLAARVGKTARLLQAKGKLSATGAPAPESIIDSSFLARLKEERVQAAELARSVAGPEAKHDKPVMAAEEPVYTYTASRADATPVGTLQLPNIAFPEASFRLTDEARATIASIAETLRSFPALCVRIVGHTNSTGDPEGNRILGKARAAAIAGHLTRLDPRAFPKERFDVQGMGADHPVLVEGVEDKAASRRTEFTLYNCTGQGG